MLEHHAMSDTVVSYYCAGCKTIIMNLKLFVYDQLHQVILQPLLIGNCHSNDFIVNIISFVVNPDGTPVVRRPNPAIPNSVIIEIAQLQVQGLTMTDAITHVRGQLVPAGYAPYPFRTNNPESVLDKLRSLVGTYHYRNTIAYWKTQGADFSLYLYVPEVDPVTESPRHDRGEHNHILKRIATSTRERRYDELDVERFDEAMLDPDTGLTHCALIGQRKQSVVDEERLLSFHVARFF